MKILFAVAFLLSTAAGVNADQSTPTEAGPIISAYSLPFKDLKAAGIEHKPTLDHCCSLLYSPGTPANERTFPTDQAYFIKVRVSATDLAPKLFKNSCQLSGFFNPTTECSTDEFDKKVKSALSVDYPGSLYGKYRASWTAYDADGEIRKTDKWGGQNIYTFKRENGIDYIVLGPVPGQPTKLTLGTNIGVIQVTDFRQDPNYKGGID